MSYDFRISVILVKSGWDPTARPEADEPRCGQKIFHQKNTCGVLGGDPSPYL